VLSSNNLTLATGWNASTDLVGIFEQISKTNVQLSVFEKLWAVCASLPFPVVENPWPSTDTALGLVSLDAE
jgi:hypothetical protein